jgi:hypothetical protein
MPANLPPDWAAVRRRYEDTHDAVATICADAGIAERELASRRKREGWRRKFPRPFPPLRRGGLPSQDPSRQSSVTPSSATTESPDPDPVLETGTGEPAPGCAASGNEDTGEASPSLDDAPPLAPAISNPSAEPALPRRLPTTLAARRRLLDRLVAAISMKLEQLERRMSKDLAQGDDTPATDHERETRAIGALIDNLEKVTEIESGLKSNPAKRNGKSAVSAIDLADEAERCRRELAERLSRLVEAAEGGS